MLCTLIGAIILSINIQVGLNMHLHDEIGVNRHLFEGRHLVFIWNTFTYHLFHIKATIIFGSYAKLILPYTVTFFHQYGLYSAFVGCFVYMIFGSCKDITIGPTAIMSFMTHEYTSNMPCHDDDEALANMAVLLAFLTGLAILVAAVFRIGEFCLWINIIFIFNLI